MRVVQPSPDWTTRRRYGLRMAEIAFPSPPLADEVVHLRPWRETDVPAMLDAFADPVFQSFSDWAPDRARCAPRPHAVRAGPEAR